MPYRVEFHQGPLDGCVEKDVPALLLYPQRRFPAPDKDKFETHYIEYVLCWHDGVPRYEHVGEFAWSDQR